MFAFSHVWTPVEEVHLIGHARHQRVRQQVSPQVRSASLLLRQPTAHKNKEVFKKG